jgi:UDP-N-acetylmuramoyl-tripeptide--D-alanyl-D-alanine ligase
MDKTNNSIDIKELYDIFKQYKNITTDSRKIEAGDLFFALKGDNFDGNVFAKDALAKGAAYCIIDNPSYKINERCILVDDVLSTLQSLAAYHRQQLQIPIIAITGTNGKTTTKELVKCVLSKKYRTYATIGNLNNHIGVPLTLLSITDDIQIAIVEMGANHPGEIETLVNIALPDFGIITNIGKAHLEGFGSFEGVIKTKGELYDFLRANNRVAFVNSDNEILTNIANGIEQVKYGNEGNGNFASAEVKDASPFLSIKYNNCTIQTNLIGSYNFENVLAAITIGKYFDVPGTEIASALENYVPTNNRSQLKKTEKNSLIIDAYNANPTSMRASLMNFMNISAENKCVILGDMRELGNDSQKEHEYIVNLLCSYDFKEIHLVGSEFKKVAASGMNTYENVAELTDFIKGNPIAGSTILIKGSNSMQLIKTVDFL